MTDTPRRRVWVSNDEVRVLVTCARMAHGERRIYSAYLPVGAGKADTVMRYEGHGFWKVAMPDLMLKAIRAAHPDAVVGEYDREHMGYIEQL